LLVSRGKSLDSELVRQNWPKAYIISRGARAEQWYLGDIDQRRSSDDTGRPRFEIVFTPP
jgi:hypothetical protein